MNFTNFVSTIATIFVIGCSTSTETTETPVDAHGTTSVVVEPVPVEVTPAVNETTTVVSGDVTSTTSSPVVCPEGSTFVEGTCQVIVTSESQTSSH